MFSLSKYPRLPPNQVLDKLDAKYDLALSTLRKRFVYNLAPIFKKNLKIYEDLHKCAANILEDAPAKENFDKTKQFVGHSLLNIGTNYQIDDVNRMKLLTNYTTMYALVFKENKKVFDLIQELKRILLMERDKHGFSDLHNALYAAKSVGPSDYRIDPFNLY